MRDYLDDLERQNKEIAQRSAEPQPANTEIRDEDKSRLYWLRKNIWKSIKNFAGKNKVLATILFLVGLYVLFVSRAAYQPLILLVRRYLLLVLLFIGVSWWVSKKFGKSRLRGKLGIGLLYLGFCAFLWFFGKGIYEYVRLYTHFQKLDKVELTELPQTQFERIQPLNSMRTLVKQELLTDTESATDPRFNRRSDGTYDFSMAVGPSPRYKVQQASKNMYKVISVSATDPAPDFSAKNQYDAEFNIGEFLLFGKRTSIAVGKRLGPIQYFNYQPSEVFFIEKGDGDWAQVVSLIQWKGWFIPRPVFGGVMVIDEYEKEGFDGTLERIFLGKGTFYSPEEIQDIPYLKGQNLVPEMVTTFTANSFRFQEGFLAPLPGYHEGDVRIPALKADQNKMPFVAFFDFDKDPYDDKLYHYYGLEPFDKDKQALNTSLFLAGDGTGKVLYIDHAERKDAYIGSSTVSSKIIESRKNYDWEKNYPVEFRPYMREVDGEKRFFWLSTVVTKVDDSGQGFIGGSIPEVTLTDARISQVVWLDKGNLPKPEAWDRQLKDELGGYWSPGQIQNNEQEEGIEERLTNTSETEERSSTQTTTLPDGFAETFVYPILSQDFEAVKAMVTPTFNPLIFQFVESNEADPTKKIHRLLSPTNIAEREFSYNWVDENKLDVIFDTSAENTDVESVVVLRYQKEEDTFKLYDIQAAG